MLIERIYIESFGKLKDISISINNKLNVIYGKNESGKSTLAAFIKFIFYGYAGERNSRLDLNEKKLYMPWTSNKASGNIIVHYKEKKYKIEREFSDREKTRIIDLSSNVAVYNGEQPGEVFFRMSEETYSKTAFVKQFDTSETGGVKLAETVQNIMFSADEDINTKNAIAKLTEAKEELISSDGESGDIILLTRKAESLRRSLESSLKNQHELLKLESSIKELEEKIMSNNAKSNELNDELENYKAYNAGQELQHIENTRRRVATLKEAYDRLIEKYSHEKFVPDEEYAETLREYGKKVDAEREKLDEALRARKKSLEKYNACEEKNKNFKIIEQAGGIETVGEAFTKHKTGNRIGLVLAVAACVMTAICTAAFVYLNFFGEKNEKITTVSLFAAIVFAGLSILFFILKQRAKNNINDLYVSLNFESEFELATSLDDYSDTEEELTTLKADLDLYNDYAMKAEQIFDGVYSEARKFLFKWNKTPESNARTGEDFEKYANLALSASEEISKAKATYEQLKLKLEETLDGVNEKELNRLAAFARQPNYEEKQITRELEFIKSKNEQMNRTEMEISRDIAVLSSKLPDPSVLRSQILYLEEKIDDLTKKYNAIDMSINLIEDSCVELKNSIAPHLTETATKLFSVATSENYQDLTVDTGFEMDVSDGSVFRDIEALSVGTRDAAYLCLRLSLMDLLYESSPPALICDESFARLDNERLDNMAKILASFAKRAQVFIFTCHEREVTAFRKHDAAVMQL